MKSRLLCVVLAVLLAGTAQAEESYLCISDKSTGFRFEEDGEWHEKSVAGNIKYLVRKPKREKLKQYALVITQVGRKFPTGWCRYGFNEYGTLKCTEGMVFLMNKNTLQYARTSLWGVLMPDGNPETAVDDVFIEIGKCSPL